MKALVQKAKQREDFSYGSETQYLYDTFEHFPVKAQHGIVLGSETPWLEAMLLSKGEGPQSTSWLKMEISEKFTL